MPMWYAECTVTHAHVLIAYAQIDFKLKCVNSVWLFFSFSHYALGVHTFAHLKRNETIYVRWSDSTWIKFVCGVCEWCAHICVIDFGSITDVFVCATALQRFLVRFSFNSCCCSRSFICCCVFFSLHALCVFRATCLVRYMQMQSFDSSRDNTNVKIRIFMYVSWFACANLKFIFCLSLLPREIALKNRIQISKFAYGIRYHRLHFIITCWFSMLKTKKRKKNTHCERRAQPEKVESNGFPISTTRGKNKRNAWLKSNMCPRTGIVGEGFLFKTDRNRISNPLCICAANANGK